MGQPVIYLKAEQASFLTRPSVQIGDVAAVYCSEKSIEKRVKELDIYTFDEHKEGRAFISVLILIRTIEAAVPEGRIQSIGGQDLVISYKPERPAVFSPFYKLKILMICMTCFFGTGISIMQYNNDVDISRIFARLYEIFTGIKPAGPTFIEFFYSLGLIVGIFLFFNHVPGKKINDEPTPIQVQMRLYERDINQTFITNASRNGEELEVNSKER